MPTRGNEPEPTGPLTRLSARSRRRRRSESQSSLALSADGPAMGTFASPRQKRREQRSDRSTSLVPLATHVLSDRVRSLDRKEQLARAWLRLLFDGGK